MGFKLTLEEIIKLLLAVAVIVIVAFAISPILISLIYPSTEEQVSKECFILLTDKIYDLDEDTEETSARCFINPGWLIKGFDKGDNSPESCTGEACLCLCTTKGFWATKWNPNCNKDICSAFNKNLAIQETEESSPKEVLIENGFFEFFLRQTERLIILGVSELKGKFGEDISKEVREEIGQRTFEETVGLPVPAGDTLPNQKFISAYEGPAFKSQGTIKELTEKHANQYSIDPALIAAVATQESGMGTNNACTKVGKTALTGCNWPPNCAKGCKCSSRSVFSDEGQLKCTASVLRVAYEQASGNEDGTYSKCVSYTTEADKWRCILCVYVSGEAGKTCNYQKLIFNLYKPWKKYYEN